MAHLLLALQVFGLVVPELYHRMSDAVGVTLAWILIALVGPWVAWRLGLSPSGKWSRVAVVLLLAALVLPRALVGWRGPDGATVVSWMAAAALAWAAARLSQDRWQRWRRVIALCACLFVFSQPVLAWVLAPRLAWPHDVPAAVAPRAGQLDGTLVLLLDELNASDAAGLEAVLKRHGFVTSRADMVPVSHATARVVAATFLGRRMDGATACTPTAICSHHASLDFAQVLASRPDIDVVGAGQPYCAIQGLRSCYRASLELTFHQRDRVACALWRRTGWPQNLTLQQCAQVYLRPWLHARHEMLAALETAPFWTRGGMLYAHLLLPHPPGIDVRQTLSEQYAANVRESEDLVDRLLAKARDQGLALRVVIYSDHPLRPGAWCRTFPYSALGCKDKRQFADAAVPLIVGAARPVDLEGLKSNDQVFKVLSRLP